MMVSGRSLTGEGHYPLNKAIEDTWKENSKLNRSRVLFGRLFAELGLHNPKAFAEIQDLFGRFGAVDSDYEVLQQGALADRIAFKTNHHNHPARKTGYRRVMDAGRSARNLRGPEQAPKCDVRRHLKLAIVDQGIDQMTRFLLDWGIPEQDFWADFGLPCVPTKRTLTADEKARARYLCFLEHLDRLEGERNPDGSPRHKRVRNKALEATAEEKECAKSTVQEAIKQCESGYIRMEP